MDRETMMAPLLPNYVVNTVCGPARHSPIFRQWLNFREQIADATCRALMTERQRWRCIVHVQHVVQGRLLLHVAFNA